MENGQGTGDTVHCFSKIRDGRKPGGNPHHASRTTQTFSAAWRTRASCSITADGMSWTRENTEQPLFVEDTPSHDSMKPITVYVNNHVRLEKINTPQHWQGLEELAERESRILYVYRGAVL